MGTLRGLAVIILALAYLLRAESSLKPGRPDLPSDHLQQHTGGSLRLIDGVVPTAVEKREDGSSKLAQQTQQQRLLPPPPPPQQHQQQTPVQQQQQQARTTAAGPSGKTHFAEEGGENVTVLVGQPAVLLCRVNNLGNRTVSWIRKRDLHILTSMAITYTSDVRFTVIGNTATSDDWNLRIDSVQTKDEGIYECQVNTEPKIHRAVYLRVLDVKVEILGQEEVHVMKGSTISLTCTVNSQGVPPSNVTWYHAGNVIDFDGPRGGVSLETEKSKGGTVSKLMITRASLGDSGNYSCVSSKAVRATAVVHVLNGEHPAAMQTGGAAATGVLRSTDLFLLLALLLQLAAGSWHWDLHPLLLLFR